MISEDPPAAPLSPAPPPRNPLKRLYQWILSWAHHPMGTWVLAVIAFLDSSVFPIPPLFLQVALSIERPRRSWWYAFVDTAASVAGAVLGYYIGYALWESVGVHLIGNDGRDYIGGKLETWGPFTILLVYSFIPFPYKLATIGSGVFHDRVSLGTLLVASTIGRAARFYILGALCFFKGREAKDFIERYFNKLMFAVGAGIAVLLIVAKYALK